MTKKVSMMIKLPVGQITSDLRNRLSSEKSARAENISVYQKTKSVLYQTHPVPLRRALAVVTNEGRVAVDADVPKANGADAYGKDVWS
jgi:hypothetical protein